MIDNQITFDFFKDSIHTVIEKMCLYFNLNRHNCEKALLDGCSAESLINDLEIDLNTFDSCNVSLIGRHLTTASKDEISSIYEKGLLDLCSTLKQDTPLSRFLLKYKIKIDVDNNSFNYKDQSIPIEGDKHSNHICFLGRNTPCSWSFGCDTFQKLSILHNKLYDLSGTLEFFVAGSLDEMLSYSTVRHYPEILETIDQLIESIHNPYSRCTHQLGYKWMTEYKYCYVVEFKTILANMETFNPTIYLDAYNEIKECFNYSNITYDDYYERRIPQRVFDNLYLIRKIIEVYVYKLDGQYGSLQSGLTIPPEDLTIYEVKEKQLILL